MIDTLEEALAVTVGYRTPSKLYVKDKNSTPDIICNAGTSTSPSRGTLWVPGPNNEYLDIYVLEAPLSLRDWKANPHLHWCIGGRLRSSGACFLDYVDGKFVEYGRLDSNEYYSEDHYPRRPPEYRYRPYIPKQCFNWVDLRSGITDKRQLGYDIYVTGYTKELVNECINSIGGSTSSGVCFNIMGKEFTAYLHLSHLLLWCRPIKRSGFLTEIIPHLAKLDEHTDMYGYVIDTPYDREKKSTNFTVSRIRNQLIVVRWLQRRSYGSLSVRAWIIDLDTKNCISFYFNHQLESFRRTVDSYSSGIVDELALYHGARTIRVIGDGVLDGTEIGAAVATMPEDLVIEEYFNRKCSVREMRECNEIPLYAVDITNFSETGKTLINMGMTGIISSALSRGNRYVRERLGINLSSSEGDPKSICRASGMSPRQIKTVDKEALSKNLRLPGVAYLRPYMPSLSQFDDETFSALCRFDTSLEQWDAIAPYHIRQFFELRSITELNAKRVSEVFSRYCNRETLNAFVEYSQYVEDLRLTPYFDSHEFPQFPKNVEVKLDEIRVVHTRYRAAIDDAKNRDKTERFQKAVERWMYLEYESEEYPYVMIVAKTPGDLVVEGTALHHCVASFDQSIISGHEIIVFMRRKSCPDTPWYTVDVTPDKRIRQVHGVCNSCVYNDPEKDSIMQFLHEWARKNSLVEDSLSSINSLLCAIR